MKKKFISLFMSVFMLAALFVPAMAEDNFVGSSTNDVTTSGTITVGEKTIYLVNSTNDKNYKEEAALLVNNASVITNEKTKTVYDNVQSGNDGEYKKLVSGVSGLKAIVVVDVTPNEAAKSILGDNTTVQITIGYAGIESNATYYAVHIGETNKEANKCSNGDGTLTFTMTGFSPVIIYKVVDNTASKTTDTSSTSTTKVVTCEDENGKGWVWSESKKACVYSVTNTSAK